MSLFSWQALTSLPAAVLHSLQLTVLHSLPSTIISVND